MTAACQQRACVTSAWQSLRDSCLGCNRPMDCIAQDQRVVQRSAIVRTISSCKGGEILTCRRIRGECNDTCSHLDATSFYILDIFDKSSAQLQSAKTPCNIARLVPRWYDDDLPEFSKRSPGCRAARCQREKVSSNFGIFLFVLFHATPQLRI